jgi:Spy/CpxP family protein refolding chaperone
MKSCGCARHEHHGECGCGPQVAVASWPGSHRHFADPGGSGFGGGAFGVRRPLRFLAWKLGLREEQLAEMAAILDALKTERAQHEVDDRRSLTLLAEAVAGETFDAARMDEAARLRVESARRLQSQVASAVARIHALLDPEQRARFAYLIRTGTLAM